MGLRPQTLANPVQPGDIIPTLGGSDCAHAKSFLMSPVSALTPNDEGDCERDAGPIINVTGDPRVKHKLVTGRPFVLDFRPICKEGGVTICDVPVAAGPPFLINDLLVQFGIRERGGIFKTPFSRTFLLNLVFGAAPTDKGYRYQQACTPLNVQPDSLSSPTIWGTQFDTFAGGTKLARTTSYRVWQRIKEDNGPFNFTEIFSGDIDENGNMVGLPERAVLPLTKVLTLLDGPGDFDILDISYWIQYGVDACDLWEGDPPDPPISSVTAPFKFPNDKAPPIKLLPGGESLPAPCG